MSADAAIAQPVEAGALAPAVSRDGDASLAPLEPARIDAAVDFLNRATSASGLQLAAAVSDYVVNEFFGGDPALLSSRDRTKTASYAALCKREDLQMGSNTLRRLVRIGQQLKQLPGEVAQQLSPGHHRALLVVENAIHKVELAKVAIAEGWTAERLEEVIGGEKARPVDAPRIGRPAKARVVKAVEAVLNTLHSLSLVGDDFDVSHKTSSKELARVMEVLIKVSETAATLQAKVALAQAALSAGDVPERSRTPTPAPRK